MSDKTYEELLPIITEILEGGNTFWAKFTCGHCGSRQIFEEKNCLFTSGRCEECNGLTVLSKWGLTALFERREEDG